MPGAARHRRSGTKSCSQLHGSVTKHIDNSHVAGRYALVGVNTSEGFTNPSGHLAVFDLLQCRVDTSSCSPLAKLDMGGQPDSVAVSPDRRYAAVAIENERDEDVNDGAIPQLPAGFLNIVDLVLEGFAVAKDGMAYAVTDNDGVDEATGETQFFRLGSFR